MVLLSDALVIGAATFAVTYLLRYTTGPFDIFSKFRNAVGIHTVVHEKGTPGAYEVEEVADKFFAKLVSCWWCLSTWVALLLVIVCRAPIIVWPAAIGVAAVLCRCAEA